MSNDYDAGQEESDEEEEEKEEKQELQTQRSCKHSSKEETNV